MKKKKLNTSPEYSGFAFGIISSEKNYRLSWLINQALGINLVKNNQPENIISLNPPLPEVFSYFDDLTNETYLLLNNKTDNIPSIIPKGKLKTIDYVFIVTEPSEPDRKNIIKNTFLKINSIHTIIEISFEVLKPEKFLNFD